VVEVVVGTGGCAGPSAAPLEHAANPRHIPTTAAAIGNPVRRLTLDGLSTVQG
jgi:hypothetical protein